MHLQCDILHISVPFRVTRIDTKAATEKSITLTWDEPANTNLDHYDLFIRPSNGLPVSVLKYEPF